MLGDLRRRSNVTTTFAVDSCVYTRATGLTVSVDVRVPSSNEVVVFYPTFSVFLLLDDDRPLLPLFDDDNDDTTKMSDEAKKVSDYFRPKKRRFEFQFQIRMKKIPEGELYMGIELDHALNMGMMQRALALTGLAFVRKMNHGFHYSIDAPSNPHPYSSATTNNNNPPNKEQNQHQQNQQEVPHLAFPILSCMDRLLATPPGGPLPPLGTDVPEPAASIKRRKQGHHGDFKGWNLRDTYTMSVFSAYVDFLAWRIVNLPGIPAFPISALAGRQAVNLNLYVFHGQNFDGPQYACGKTYLTGGLELSRIADTGDNSETMMGKKCKEWLSSSSSPSIRHPPQEKEGDGRGVEHPAERRSSANTTMEQKGEPEVVSTDHDDNIMVEDIYWKYYYYGQICAHLFALFFGLIIGYFFQVSSRYVMFGSFWG